MAYDEERLRVHRVVAPVRQQVADQIRNAIVEAYFKPGQRLTERELTNLTGVSRPTLREALRQLAAEELITTAPGRGWVVAELKVKDAIDLYEVRAQIEGLAGRLFVERADDDQVRALVEAFENLKTTFAGHGDLHAKMNAKNEFYGVLFAGSQSQTIVSIIEGLHARVSVLRARSLSHPDREDGSLTEISAIVDAILAKDADRAVEMCVYHVNQAAKWALKDLDHSSPTDVVN